MEQLVGISAASRRLNVSIDTVRRWADRGVLPHIKVENGARGSDRVFRIADLDALAIERAAQKQRRESEKNND